MSAFPSDSLGTWLVHDGRSWVEVKGLRCRLSDEAEAAKVEIAPAPLRIELVHAATSGGASDGAGATSPAREYAGIYVRQEGHVNKSAAWRRVRTRAMAEADEDEKRTEHSCWLVRGRNGCWVGQRGAQMGQDAGQLQLPFTACALPTSASPAELWQEWKSSKWHDVAGMTCVVLEQGPPTPVLVGSAVASSEGARHGAEHAHGHAQGGAAGGCAEGCTHEHGHDGGEAARHEHEHTHEHV